MELAPQAREAWLAGLAGSDPERAATLRELLAEQALLERAHFLEQLPLEALAGMTLSGQQVGAYRIERLIGQGGMGAVWLAERCDGRYQGKAAVKFLNAALIGGPAEQRFVREGSLLAALQHPNIAHLIDAGVAAGGQPYLILEYVEGRPVDEYCSMQRLGVRARLRLFLEVLAAVACAHRHLVVHRDIKPANILVSGDGRVKLLDFGVAALMEPAAEAAAAVTRELGAALTPEYAAPEQLLGQPVTTATDIYALGRVLYVLLGGPEAPPGLRCSAAGVATDTTERDPPLLSAVVSGAATRRLLRGDLENIVRKAMKKEPAERYSTVEAFADDLRHYLADEPVSARADSFAYRVGKFVRRHRGAVLSGAATALALIAVTAFAVSQMLEAQRQRDEAEAQRQRSEGYSTAITALLSQPGPDGRALTAEELLARAVEQVEATYADDPPFLVQMLILISGRYFDLRNTEQEYATLARAEKVARESGDALLVLKVQCNTVETELAFGRVDAARRRLDEALSLLPSVGEVAALDHAACLRAQSDVAMADGNLAASLGHMEEARRVLEAGGRTEGNVYGGILSGLAAYNGQAGNLLTAHGYWLELVELDRRLGRHRSMPGLIARVALANSFSALGEVNHAALLHEEAARDQAPPGPAEMFYGEVLARLGRHDEALRLIHEAIEEIDAGGHQEFRIRARLALARGLLFASRPAEAGDALAAANSLMEQDDVQYLELAVEAHRLRAEAALADGRLEEADREIAAAWQRLVGPARVKPREARLLLTEARLRLQQAAPAEAAAAARAAALLFEQNTLDTQRSADVGEAMLLLAEAESALGNSEAARLSLDRAHIALRSGLGAGHRLTLLAENLSSR